MKLLNCNYSNPAFSFIERGNQTPKQGDSLAKFFPGDKVENLVRESAQNAIDAKSEENNGSPVKVKFTLGEFNAQEIAFLFGGDKKLDEFNKHAFASRKYLGKSTPADIHGNLEYVLIEDLHTTGLTGDFDQESQDAGALEKFWWSEAISSKQLGSGGSHGVGKEMLAFISKSRAFFALSKREDDDEEILIGFCRLGIRKLDDVPYMPFARWGVLDHNGSSRAGQLPLYPASISAHPQQASVIKEFKEKLQIERGVGSYGTSIFIPNVENKSFEGFIHAAISNLYLPILEGVVEVEIIDRVANKKEFIDADSLYQTYEGFYVDENDKLGREISLADSMCCRRNCFYPSPEFQFTKATDELSEESFEAGNLEEMRSLYSNFEPINVIFSLPVKPVGGKSQSGFFKLTVQKAQEDEVTGAVFRGNIRISGLSISNSRAHFLVNVPSKDHQGERNPLSEFFKFCEDPGHRVWDSPNRGEDDNRYTYTWPKDAISRIVKKLTSLLENEDREELDEFAPDLFCISIEDLSKSKNSKRKTSAEKIEIEPAQHLCALSKIAKGFSINPTKNFKDKYENLNKDGLFEVRVGFRMLGVSDKTALKRSADDIDFGSDEAISIQMKEAKLVSALRNQFLFQPTGRNFHVEVTGFQESLDLHVEVIEDQLEIESQGK